MKKFTIILLILLCTVGAVFASEANRWYVGANFGTASMVEMSFNGGDIQKQNSNLGIGADIRVDYELVQDTFLTGIIGWEMPDRTFLVANPALLADVKEAKQNYLTLFAGVSLGHMIVDPPANDGETPELVWTGTAGPQMWINLNQGKVGFGATGILKGSYPIADNVTLDLSGKVSAMGIKDSPMDSKIHFYTDLQVKAGCTYNF